MHFGFSSMVDEAPIDNALEQANASWYQGSPKDALEHYARAVELLAESTPLQMVVTAKNAYAPCLCEVGDFEAAMPIYPELEELCRAPIDLWSVCSGFGRRLMQFHCRARST